MTERRKRIGCIMANPEHVYAQRILSGLEAQCTVYNYDLLVFSPMATLGIPQKDYLEAELNIFNLINFDLLDAIVIVPLTLLVNNDYSVINRIQKLIEEKCDKPVVSLDYKIGNFDTIYTDDKSPFYDIMSHLVKKHGCETVYFLAGQEDSEVSNIRIEAVKSAAKSLGMPDENLQIFNGDFWYTSGNQLAERIISGELDMPDAIVCANDYMALGIENTLRTNNYSVPRDVILTGYDSSQDGLLNDTTIASYIPKNKRLGMEAVNHLHKIISPDEKGIEVVIENEDGLCIAESCGCPDSNTFLKQSLSDYLYRVNRNEQFGAKVNSFDIGRLMESYMFESLAAESDPQKCLEAININAYLLEPFDAFYLCLCKDWLDTTKDCLTGYPDTMIAAISKLSKYHPDYSIGKNKTCLLPEFWFDTKELHPKLKKDWETSNVYYFIPVHFGAVTLGYAVLQYATEKGIRPTVLHRTWLRNVQNTLEMLRIKNKFYMQTLRDGLTGAYNRNKLREICEPGTKKLVMNEVGLMMLDIDFFKKVNDTFGHLIGDDVLVAVTEISKKCIAESDLVVRWGGEEFVIFCMGCNDKEKLKALGEKIRLAVESYEDGPAKITVSIGIAIYEGDDYEASIENADKALYYAKQHGRNQVAIYNDVSFDFSSPDFLS